MIRKLMILGLVITFVSSAAYVFAEDVFITPKGAKYHKEICRLVKNKENVTKLDKEEALEEGYGPCKRCFGEDVIAQEDNGPEGPAQKISQKSK